MDLTLIAKFSYSDYSEDHASHGETQAYLVVEDQLFLESPPYSRLCAISHQQELHFELFSLSAL